MIKISLEDILTAPLISGCAFDPEGKFFIYSSNKSGIPQLYLEYLDREAEPTQLTSGDAPFSIYYLSPKGDSLAIIQDEHGSEISDVFLLSLLGNEKLKKLSKVAYRTYGTSWHPDGEELTRSYVSTEGNGLETFNMKTGESFKLKEKTLPISSVSYSPNGKWLACQVQSEKSAFFETQIINRKNPQDVVKIELSEKANAEYPIFSPNNKWVSFYTDVRGVNQVAVQEFQGQDQIFLDIKNDEEVQFSPDLKWHSSSEKIYYILNKHGRLQVQGQALGGVKDVPLPFPAGCIDSFKIDKKFEKVLAVHSSLNSPHAIYLYQFDTETIKKVSPKSQVDLSSLPEPQSVWFDSFDGRKIHAWYLPPRKKSSKKAAAIVYVHGGPTGQVLDWWFEGSYLQAINLFGFGVITPNFRGSTGYGPEFRDLNIGDIGGGDLEDVIHAAGWLRERSEINESKIAILGASYGGYMTLMALGKKPDVFNAGISLVPVIDWIEDIKFDPTKFFVKFFQGTPEEKEDLYRERSPITYVDNVKKPLMIIAGATDARCPIEPIRDYIKKLKERNFPHEYIEKGTDGHVSSFSDADARVTDSVAILRFLKKALR